MRGKIYFTVIFMFITLIQASAYLDPGTGSMIVSAIIGVFATIAYMFRGFFYKLLKLLRIKSKKTDENSEA